MNARGRLTERFGVTEANLDLRKRFIGLTGEVVRALRELRPWAARVADQVAREFYDHQFTFGPTLAFFEAHAPKKSMTAAQLRQHLERMQAEYFRQIFQEAAAAGRFGVDYFEKRLSVGRLHNVINLPLKWYLGSYTLYEDLVRKHLRKHFRTRPGFRARAERAIRTVFNYDMQAVADAYFFDYLESIGLDLDGVRVQDAERDLSDDHELLKTIVRAKPLPAARAVTRTFMFTDIVKSTALVEALGDESWGDLLRWHDQTLRSLFAEHAGEEIDQAGDGFFVTFEDATRAVDCAVAIQQRLADQRRDHGFSPQVRIGLHTAPAARTGRSYRGRGVHVAARIGALAEAGAIVASEETLRASKAGTRASELREVSLRGISDRTRVAGIDWRHYLRGRSPRLGLPGRRRGRGS